MDLSSNVYAIYFDLDSLNCCPEWYASLSMAPKSPFSPIDMFKCELTDTSCVHLELYDLLGNLRRIWEEDRLLPGQYEFDFRDLRLEHSVYIVRMRLNDGDFRKGFLLL